jgi:predicted transposase YdaD
VDLISTEIARQGKAARIAAYWDAIIRANAKTIQELLMRNTLTIEQVLENVGLTAKWEARGKAEGEARGKAEGRAEGEEHKAFSIAQNMVNLGLPLETVVSATQLEPEKVKPLYH